MKCIKYILFFIIFAAVVFATDPPHCLSFKDWDDHIMIDDEPFKFSSRFTIECWFNIEEFSDSSALIDFSSYGLREGHLFGYGIYLMDSSRITVNLGNSTRSFEMIIDSIKTGIWYHFAVTYDKFKNDENVVAFLNGRVIKKGDCDIYLEYPETFRPYGLVLGAFYDYPFLKAFKGSLDDVRFWSDVRTNEEILQNIDRSIDPNEEGLVAYYTFDHEESSLLLDAGPNNYHGSLENISDTSWQLSYAHLAVEQPMDVSFDRVVLPWTSSHHFDSYCVDISQNIDFSTSIDGFPVSGVNTNYFPVDSISPGSYYFRAKGHYDGQAPSEEPWTDVQAFSTTNEAATPITLSDFDLRQNKGTVRVDWLTASQTENSCFILERKDKDKGWTNIYRIPGEGTNSEISSYRYIDHHVVPGDTYTYRLKDVSYSGKVSISEERKITVEEQDEATKPGFQLISVYPNPFNPETRISFELYDKGMVDLSVYSLNGEKIASVMNGEMEPGAYNVQWKPKQISTGVYILNLQLDNTRVSHKLLYIK